MKISIIFRLMLISALFLFIYERSDSQTSGRDILNFNFDWKFMKGDQPGAEKKDFKDVNWRKLDLPHDWSIEGPFSKEWASGTGYLPGGIGWYRKSFTIPSKMKGRKIFIDFDGVYNNSEVWINGNYLGKRPNGYISFQYDLTPFLNYGKPNTISVKVDHTRFGDSRWYTGSGIYRNVKLIATSQVHIRNWGVHYTTPEVSPEKAKVDIEVTVMNELKKNKSLTIHNWLLYGNDTLGRASQKISIEPSAEKTFSQSIEIGHPKMWDVGNPVLYSLVTVLEGNEVSDIVRTGVGIRTFRFDPDKGFFLNGKSLKLKGICLHHDAGALGSAVPRKEIERRLDLLKDLGCNAIRTSHNPFSSDFLDICDEKGFIVIGEAFDEWELPKKKWIEGWNKGTPGKDGYSSVFKEWATTDLRDFVLRDRNHPSVSMWSIGNEVDYPNDPYTHTILNTEANPQTWAKYDQKLPDANRLGVVAKELVAVIKQLDTTRPVTAGLASALMSNETGYSDALDVVGYNYQEFRYAADHRKYPGRPLYGSENGMTLEAWNAVMDNDFVMGQFLWTGFEYLGEAGQFPSRHSTSGVIDLAGNRKPEFYFRQSLWSDKPMVWLGTTDRVKTSGPVNLWVHKRVDPVWNWNEGQSVSVNAFTNCEEVELFFNNISLGVKRLSDAVNRVITWEIPFKPGTLKAVAKIKGYVAASCELKTTGTPTRIIARADTGLLKADRTDIIRVFVNIADDEGNTVYSAENEITCDVSGPVKIIGMEDANPVNIEDYKDNKQKAFHGRLLVYLQSIASQGKARITLSSAGLKSSSLEINVIEY
jgi:beta-galactosidase